MALKDSIRTIGRFIGVLQPDQQSGQPMLDRYGYPPDDGYYGGTPYDNGGYDNPPYGSAQQQGGYPPYGTPPPQQQGGRAPYYGAEEEFPPRATGQQQRPTPSSPFSFSQQPTSPFGNQRSKHPPNNVVPLNRPEDGGVSRSNKHSEMIIHIRVLEDCREIIDALLEAKSVFINMETIDDTTLQRVIDMLGGAAFALRGTMTKISHRTYLLAPSSVDVVNNPTQVQEPAYHGEFSSFRR